MHMLNVTLVRLVQLIACLFFTGVVLVYVSGLLLLPLALLKAIISVLADGIGFNGVFAAIVAIPAVIWLGLRVHRIPSLSQTLVDTGWALVRMGADNFRKFDAIAKSGAGCAEATAPSSVPR